ncbi:hypothetical protein [Metapseudomonas otitidis]|jgi:hypothetical protein|uniref:hypothetical protein n=1 Tax=Metapseudomonas otitidis TaxID=319939 RepID=UPI002097A219|nr:hypothetical protein [Pseudomonas otitidis]MCO7556196.1 hypothetical protein [Pseudomonas otitidis]
MSKGSAPQVAESDKWRIEDDLRTLLRAEEIKKDSKRMAAVRRMAGEKLTELKQLSAR